jgi:Sec-independent protein secretion pathway component TatC
MILYEFGIWLAKIVAKRKAKRERAAALAEAESADQGVEPESAGS